MAQVFVPDDPRVRDQLQQGGISAELVEQPQRRVPRRRYGMIDLVVLLAVIAAITLLVLAAARWTAPQTPVVSIDLSPLALPAYAGYSLLRMILAYLLSLVFTLVYGHIAATNRRAEAVMVPIALPHGKSFFVRFKPLFSSNSKRVCPPRLQRRSSALEQERNMVYVKQKEEEVS